MEPQLVGLVLEVQDIERSIAFYRDGLELRLGGQQEGDGLKLAYLESETAELTLVQHEEAEGEAPPQYGAGVVVRFEVEDLGEQVRRLQKAKARLVRPLEEAPWGGRVVIVADPDGYNLMFTGP